MIGTALNNNAQYCRIHWPVAFTTQNTQMCRRWTF